MWSHCLTNSVDNMRETVTTATALLLLLYVLLYQAEAIPAEHINGRLEKDADGKKLDLSAVERRNVMALADDNTMEDADNTDQVGERRSGEKKRNYIKEEAVNERQGKIRNS